MQYVIEGQPERDIDVKYCKEDVSSFNEVLTTAFASSLEHCKEIAVLGDSSILEDDQYSPLRKFHVRKICVDSKIYLDYDIEDTEEDDIFPTVIYSFPQAVKNDLILHGPEEINGQEYNKTVIGIVSGHHGSNITYTWYHNGNPIVEGSNMCIIPPEKEGSYHWVIQKGEECVISHTVNVIKKENFPVVPKKASSHKTIQSTSKQNIPAVKNIKLSATDNFQVPLIDIKEVDIIFEEKNKLGEGSFGSVYKGNWLGTDIAVKTMKLGRRNALTEVIENEIKVLGSIRHPNIIQIMAIAKTKQKIHVISEFVDGLNLEEIIFEHRKEEVGLSTDKKTLVALHAAKALAYLHGMTSPIIHQDIKPANYLVQKVTLVTKLCDLGVSRTKSLNATHTTNLNIGAGTPAYMAPESLLHPGKGTSHSDMWSYGISMAEFFAESDGWEMEETEDVVEFLRECVCNNKTPDTVSKLLAVTQCDSDTKSLIIKMLDYSPEKRLPAIEAVRHFQKYISH